VGARAPEIPVDDDDRDQDGDRVHDEGEEQVLGDQRQDQRRRRKNLWDEQQEDDEREQNADAEGHFLAGLGGQVEDEDAEERNENGGQDQVDGVEEGLSPDGDVEGDVGLRRDRVVVDVEVGRYLDDVPRARFPVVGQVNVVLVVVQCQADLENIENLGLTAFHLLSFLNLSYFWTANFN